MSEIFGSQRGYRDQPVGARLIQPDEQAEAGHAGDATGEGRPNPFLQEGGHIAVHGGALGGHGAALGHGHLFGDGGQFGDLAVGQSVLAQSKGADQAAVDDQVGIAPDRRGEVGVAVEVQAEMAHVPGRIDGLHLAAQDDLVDDLGVVAAAGLVQQLVEPYGRGRFALGPRLADGLEEVAEVEQLLLTGRVVDAVQQGCLLLLQRLCGADIGLDHHLLDQPVGLEADAGLDRDDLALVIHADAAFGAFDGQRTALQPTLQHGAVGVPERLEDGLHDRAGRIIRLAVDGGLGLFVAELGQRPHQAADELMSCFAAVLVEDHAHGHAGAVLALLEAAQAVRQPLGQHRLDAVGEVGGVALVARLAVEVGVGADVGSDVGDGDPDDPAVDILRVLVAHRIDGVVVIAGVGGVNGDQRQVAQVLAALQRRKLLILGLLLDSLGEAHRDVVGGDGDQGGGAGVALMADLLEDLAALGPIALVALFDRGQHEVAVAQALGLGVRDDQNVFRLAVGGLDPDLLIGSADHAQHLVGAGVELLDQPGFPAVLSAGEFDQDAVAHARGGTGLAAVVGDQQGARGVGRSLDQTDIEFAVEVALDHIGDADRGHGADLGEALAAALAQLAGLFEFADHFAQGAALAALQAEMARDIGFLGCSGFAEEGDQRFFVGESGDGPAG